ncbi:cupin domain-containing protein [Cupriavidus sp. WS]|uniref:cupin domain-containing protein n=1 Tax=Cupriavidus sp. WS TaxID=1312922 RepID=UPI0012DD3947|nr:cupin domain-containing protein [Cupriavidus sp. WS]
MKMTQHIPGSELTQHAAQAQSTDCHHTDLVQHDLLTPDCEVVQVRVEFITGHTSPSLPHPGEVTPYVLEGTWEYRIKGPPPVTLKASEGPFIPVGAAHSAKLERRRPTGPSMHYYSEPV